MTFLLAFVALAAPKPPMYFGGDPSEIPQVEAEGGKYFLNGKQEDPFKIMKAEGWTAVRFRVWVNPPDKWCDEAHTLALAKRARAAGLKIMIDPHFADSWADPQKQPIPAAWAKMTYPQLKSEMYKYTYGLVHDLVAQGTPPSVVQIGNEVTAGFMWPMAKLTPETDNWPKFSGLLREGLKAVHDAAGPNHIETMIHIDRGGDPVGTARFVAQLQHYHVSFNILGLSYYPWWHGHIDAMEENIRNLSHQHRFSFMIAETAYPYETPTGAFLNYDGRQKLEPGYPATKAGQAKFLALLTHLAKTTPGMRGVLWWAPCWIPTKGNDPWRNLCLFDEKGNVLPAAAAFKSK